MMSDDRRATLEQRISAVLNECCAENESNTPDHILATYLLDCLEAWNAACRLREAWYGVRHAPNASTLPPPAIIIEPVKPR